MLCNTTTTDNCQINGKLHYVVLATPVKDSIDGLHCGAHILLERKHYLIESIDTQTKSFSAYSVDQTKKIKLYEGLTLKEVQTTKAEDDQLITKILVCTLHCRSSTIEEALERVEVELKKETKRKWESSDRFVTAMLCGIQHSISERYLIDHNVAPTGCTLITPKVTVKEGDHLAIKHVSNDWMSVIVQEYLDDTRVKVKPHLDDCEMIDLTTHPEIYRIDYSESILPVKEALKRANSDIGNEILRSNQSHFVTWAKIGREIPVTISELLKDMPTTKQRRVSYFKTSSLATIKPGDHLVEYSSSKMRHFMVTEHEAGTSFSTISCCNTIISEESEIIDVSKGRGLYRIEYADELLTQTSTAESDSSLVTDSVLAVKKARSLLGQKMHNLWAPMLFITWAKTGAIEGFELTTSSNPVSKSIIKSFDQLVPGDYLIVTPLCGWNHHYIVVSIESSVRCTVIEHFYRGQVSKTELTLCDPDKFPRYYRVNYEQGGCLPNEFSISQAEQCLNDAKQLSGINYQNFVHYLKTEEKVKINIDQLKESEHEPRLIKMYLGAPLYIQAVSSPDLLTGGDHVVYRRNQPPYDPAYQSAVVIDVLQSREVKVATVTLADGFTTKKISFNDVLDIYQVIYHSCLSQSQVLAHVHSYRDKKGKYNYDETCHSSHHFVIRCKMGKECPLAVTKLLKLLTQLAITEMKQGR